MAALSRDIQEEAQPSTQVENTKDKVGAIFEARGETAKDKTDKVDMCFAPYQQTTHSGIFLPHSGIHRPQRGIIGISLLAVTFRNNYFIPEKI